MPTGTLAEAIARTLGQWTAEGRVARLWNKDASLWTSSGEERWLGWLDIVEVQRVGEAELGGFGNRLQLHCWAPSCGLMS